jgi:hypothetical protein
MISIYSRAGAKLGSAALDLNAMGIPRAALYPNVAPEVKSFSASSSQSCLLVIMLYSIVNAGFATWRLCRE